jgi:hypothetical protein
VNVVGSLHPVESECLVIGKWSGLHVESRGSKLGLPGEGPLPHVARRAEMEMGGLFLNSPSSTGEAPTVGENPLCKMHVSREWGLSPAPPCLCNLYVFHFPHRSIVSTKKKSHNLILLFLISIVELVIILSILIRYCGQHSW